MRYNKDALMQIVELYLNDSDINCKELDEFKEEILRENSGKREKIIFENEDLICKERVVWNKKNLFFDFEFIDINKKTGECMRIDSAHGVKHVDDKEFKLVIPMFVLFKIEHPILKIILNSLSIENQRLWKEKLCRELFISQGIWDKTLKNPRMAEDTSFLRRELNSLVQNIGE
ncbi:MAG: hypothetical protein M1416_02840 [Candidatus Pacearchaeota archaeon]|nr:hypothetical protein [Candidatus Pacearchaeota archaeon]